MGRIRRMLQHTFNPLHVFCRLRDVGFTTTTARRMCSAYERLFFKTLMF